MIFFRIKTKTKRSNVKLTKKRNSLYNYLITKPDTRYIPVPTQLPTPNEHRSLVVSNYS